MKYSVIDMENKITGTLYAVFRISDRKIKNTTQLKNWENHMDRTFNTPNADPTRKNNNEIIIGTPNIMESFKNHTKGIKFRKNGIWARDIVLSASPEFFNKLNNKQIRDWVQLNKEFLLKEFGDNCIYAVCHRDEKSPHIQACIVPRYTNKKGQNRLNNDIYFGGRQMYSEWQDKYSEAMKGQFKDLNRGIKNSKATHVQVRQFYQIINQTYNEKDYKTVIAKAQNSELLQKKVADLQNTLKVYWKSNVNVKNEIEEMKKDKEAYRLTIKAVSEIYKIPQEVIKEVIKGVENGKIKNNDKGKELKR